VYRYRVLTIFIKVSHCDYKIKMVYIIFLEAGVIGATMTEGGYEKSGPELYIRFYSLSCSPWENGHVLLFRYKKMLRAMTFIVFCTAN